VSLLNSKYPAVGHGLAVAPGIANRFSALNSAIVKTRADFRLADQIPVGGVSPTAVPWVYIVGGILLTAGGLLGVIRPVRALSVLSAVFALALVVVPFAVSMPSKAAAVDRLNAVFAPAFTPAAGAQRNADVAVVADMSSQLQQQALPGIATLLGLSPTQFNAVAARRYPALVAGVANLNGIVGRARDEVNLLKEVAPDAHLADQIPTAGWKTTALTWTIVGPAAIALLAALGSSRRESCDVRQTNRWPERPSQAELSPANQHRATSSRLDYLAPPGRCLRARRGCPPQPNETELGTGW
jgi:hypothetical protein